MLKNASQSLSNAWSPLKGTVLDSVLRRYWPLCVFSFFVVTDDRLVLWESRTEELFGYTWDKMEAKATGPRTGLCIV